MATPESQQRNTPEVEPVLPQSDREIESDDSSSSPSHQPSQLEERDPELLSGGEIERNQSRSHSNDGDFAQRAKGRQLLAHGHEHDEADLEKHLEDMPLDESDAVGCLVEQSSAAEHSSPPPECSAMSSPGHKSSNLLSAGAAPSGFMFPRLDRRNLGLGGKRRELHQVVPQGSNLPANVISSQDNEQHSETETVQACSSPVLVAMDGGAVHSASMETATSGSGGDFNDGRTSSSSKNLNQSAHKDHAQYQVDEQITREASMSDGLERELSSEAPGDDGMHLRANEATSYMSERASVPETNYQQVVRPIGRSMVPTRRSGFADPVRNSMANRRFAQPLKPALDPRLNPFAARQQPRVHASPGRSARRVNAPVSAPVSAAVSAPNDTQDLLDVVAYKFKEKEQSLQRAFSAGQKRMQSELQRAYTENETLRSQVAAFEEQCNQSEVAISKYRSQIGKAKGLQKFLDGLGNDLHSLKRSHELEKINFAMRIEASETEIERLECSLAGKDGFEIMLSHSKTTLEKLIDAKSFELQSVIQHRDMLRSQLDERIGQLVEERDARMRLEHLVGQLRLDGRVSLTASLEQVTTSLLSKMSSLGQQGDGLAIEVASMNHDVQSLTQRRPATLDDCRTIKAEMHELGLRIAQGLSIEATTNTTVADLTTAVEGLIQSHMQTLRRGLDRMETNWKESASSHESRVALEAQLRGAHERLAQLECQLNAVRNSESSATDALDKSLARISELEAVVDRSPTPSSGGLTPQDVELKVITIVSSSITWTDRILGPSSSRSCSKATLRQRQCLHRSRKGAIQ